MVENITKLKKKKNFLGKRSSTWSFFVRQPTVYGERTCVTSFQSARKKLYPLSAKFIWSFNLSVIKWQWFWEWIIREESGMVRDASGDIHYKVSCINMDVLQDQLWHLALYHPIGRMLHPVGTAGFSLHKSSCAFKIQHQLRKSCNCCIWYIYLCFRIHFMQRNWLLLILLDKSLVPMKS